MKAKNRNTLYIIKRLLAPILKTPILYIRAFIVFSLWGISGIAPIFFLEKIIYFLENGDKSGFLNVIIIYIAFLFISGILLWLTKKWGWVEIGAKTIENIHDDYMKNYIKLDNNYVEKIGTGKTIAVIESGFKAWSDVIFMVFQNGISLIFVLSFTFYMLVKVNFIYAIVFILLYILFHFIVFFLNSYMLRYRRLRIEAGNEHTKNLVKIIMSKIEILQSGRIKTEINKLDKNTEDAVYYNGKMAIYVLGFFRIPTGGMSIILIICFLILGLQVIEGTLSLSILVGLSSALILMRGAIDDSVRLFKDVTKEFTSIEKLWDFFDNTPDIQGYEEGKDFKYKRGEIELKNINFGYTKKQKIFNNFDLKLAPGKITAIVGNSGSGKTTLVKLISGYIRADSGEVFVDEQKLSSVNLKSYYKEIGYLTQEPSVFDGSIRENLEYSTSSTYKKEDLNKIVKLAKCDFIHDFEKGLDTEIGEKGIRLSGGQRQRLAIAKIMLKDPKIIILDEPTSALDSFSEEQITKALNNLFKGKTVIVIAHRLQTVKSADKILFIQDGKVIEDGTHSELVKQNGQYKQMLDLQTGF